MFHLIIKNDVSGVLQNCVIITKNVNIDVSHSFMLNLIN